MKKIVFSCILLLSGIFSYVSGQENSLDIIYILDEQPIDPKVMNYLDPQELASIDVLKTPETIEKYGYKNVSGIIKIYTSAYNFRPDSLRLIPMLSSLNQQGDKWYNSEHQLYSGPFVEYYLSGRLKRKGKIQNGSLDGCIESYYPNGSIREQVFWKNGEESGAFVSYYVNGRPKSGYLPYGNHPEWDQLKSWYSDGRVKYVAVKGKKGWKYKGKWNKIRKDLEQGRKFQEEGDLKKAEKFYNKAIHREDSCADAYAEKARLEIQKENLDGALRDINMAIELDPYRMELYRERAFYRIRKYLGNEVELSDPEKVPDITALPAYIQEVITRDVEKAYIVLKEQDLLLSKMLFKYKKKKLNVDKGTPIE